MSYLTVVASLPTSCYTEHMEHTPQLLTDIDRYDVAPGMHVLMTRCDDNAEVLRIVTNVTHTHDHTTIVGRSSCGARLTSLTVADGYPVTILPVV